MKGLPALPSFFPFFLPFSLLLTLLSPFLLSFFCTISFIKIYCIPGRWQVLGIEEVNRNKIYPLSSSNNHNHKWDAQMQYKIQWDTLKVFRNSNSTHMLDFMGAGPDYNLPGYVYYSSQPVNLLASSPTHKTFSFIHWCVYRWHALFIFLGFCAHICLYWHMVLELHA